MLNISKRTPSDSNEIIDNVVSKLVADTKTLDIDISDDCNEYIEMALYQNKIKTIQKIEKIIDDTNRNNRKNLLLFKEFYSNIIKNINTNAFKLSTNTELSDTQLSDISLFVDYVHSYDYNKYKNLQNYESIVLEYPYIKWTIDILTPKLYNLGYQIKFSHKCRSNYESSLSIYNCGLSITIE